MRNLDIFTLDNAARHFAVEFGRNSVKAASGRYIRGRSYVMQDLVNLTYKDEFEFVVDAVQKNIQPDLLGEFDIQCKKAFTPRSDATLEFMLAGNLAITPEGEHISGMIGTIIIGSRIVGKREHVIERREPRTLRDKWNFRKGRLIYQRTIMKNHYWPVYAGELEERVLDSGVADPLPAGYWPMIDEVYATNPKISNECAILGLDAIVDNFDEGTGAAVIQGRTGAQPADPDTPVSGTLLFTLVMSDPAFGGAADDTGKATATAGAVTDDISADATGTLGYCRLSSTNDGATPLDDHLDGEAGTSGSDYNFNTLSIVSGATVSLTSMTVSLPE